MPKEDVDQDKVRISVAPPPNSTLRQVDEVYILITQAFCPNGHSLIEEGENLFDDHPGVKVILESESGKGEVILSPFQGDATKKGKTDWKSGEKVTMMCPTCKEALPKLASCKCSDDGELMKVYLTADISDSHVVGVCNIWGCQRSRTINNWQIISEYLDGQIEE